MTDLKHTRDTVDHEFDRLSSADILARLRANPPGTLHTLPEQWPVIRPLLVYLSDVSTEEVRLALVDFVSVTDAQLNPDAAKPSRKKKGE